MTLNEYQDRALSTAIYPGRWTYVGLSYVNGKLNGEAGEFSEHVAKILRDDFQDKYKELIFHNPTPISAERRAKMLKELGDVIWYVAAAAMELNATLDEIADSNLAKLASRKEHGTLRGSGSER